jgi:excisionase family DNA binding protein
MAQERTLLTVREAAKWLEVSTSEIYLLCKYRKLRHSRIGLKRGVIRIEISDLEVYRRSCIVEPVEPARLSPVVGRQVGYSSQRFMAAVAARKALNKLRNLR